MKNKPDRRYEIILANFFRDILGFLPQQLYRVTRAFFLSLLSTVVLNYCFRVPSISSLPSERVHANEAFSIFFFSDLTTPLK